ncbi:MAG TPA: aminopeptidase P N-terminal domain-containing protein [Gemmatimonadales bacterium]|nr:aminopeptidase P N-terminal domain-containing protein [Gemmatimonadales bacterium]
MRAKSLGPAVLLALAAAAPLRAQISSGEYAARRDSLATRVAEGVVVAFGGRTPVADFGPFYQLPAFRYLTGYEYADAALVMVVHQGRGTSTLFVNRSTPRRALYYGEEPDSAALVRELGLASRGAADLARVMDSLAAAQPKVYGLRHFEDADFAATDSLTRGGQFLRALAARHPGLVVLDAHPMVDQLRARKSPAELALIRKAAEISDQGHLELMRQIEAGMHEYDLQAIIEYTFRRGGAERPAYGSIVGAGPNGTQLHYMKDRRELKPGEIVVVDAAAEFAGYTADVTRTIPVSGVYSPEQRALYQVVRDGQAAAERNSLPGKSIQAAQDSSLDVRARGLAALGLIESPTATFDPPWPADCAQRPRACQQVSLFAIHGISHGLGLAVHDPLQAYYGDGTFKQGDAFTIEPGVYVSTKLLEILPDTPKNRIFRDKVRKAVERYQNNGVRIEDDYVITEKGLEWITRVPREIDEIEAVYRQRKVRAIP